MSGQFADGEMGTNDPICILHLMQAFADTYETKLVPAPPDVEDKIVLFRLLSRDDCELGVRFDQKPTNKDLQSTEFNGVQIFSPAPEDLWDV